MATKIQHILWKLASYDTFILKYCSTLPNNIAGIGSFFLFQILIVFSSVYITSFEFTSNNKYLGLFFSLIASFGFYFWMKFLNKIHHQSKGKAVIGIQLFANLILSIILSVPFCISLFDHQIRFQLYIKTGRMDFGITELILLKPYGLFESWIAGEEGAVILFVCFAILVIVAFIFIRPYMLILKYKNSSYTTLKQHYDRNFKKKI